MNDKVHVEIFKRKLTVEMEGLTPLEIKALADDINAKMEQVSDKYKDIVDSQKLAILTALELAADLYHARNAHADERRVAENKVDTLVLALRSSMGEG